MTNLASDLYIFVFLLIVIVVIQLVVMIRMTQINRSLKQDGRSQASETNNPMSSASVDNVTQTPNTQHDAIKDDIYVSSKPSRMGEPKSQSKLAAKYQDNIDLDLVDEHEPILLDTPVKPESAHHDESGIKEGRFDLAIKRAQEKLNQQLEAETRKASLLKQKRQPKAKASANAMQAPDQVSKKLTEPSYDDIKAILEQAAPDLEAPSVKPSVPATPDDLDAALSEPTVPAKPAKKESKPEAQPISAPKSKPKAKPEVQLDLDALEVPDEPTPQLEPSKVDAPFSVQLKEADGISLSNDHKPGDIFAQQSELDAQISMATAYLETGRWLAAKQILVQVLNSPSVKHKKIAQQLADDYQLDLLG